MMRFEVRGEMEGLGEIKHVVRATDQIDAWERMKNAYKGREAKLIRIVELKNGKKK